MIQSLHLFFKRLNKDERGLTLVEILASSLIFFVIVIPLVSVYIKGVEIYQDTGLKNELRNETDFIIGHVMRTIQEASYVKLAPTPGDTMPDPAEGSARSIVAAAFPDFSEGVSSSSSLYLFKRSVKTSENSQTRSLLTRETHSFEPCLQSDEDSSPCTHLPFPFDQDRYLVTGFFQLDPAVSDASGKKHVTLYLIAALRYHSLSVPHSEEDKSNHELFADWAAVENAWVQNTDKAQYIRVVRTEIDLSTEQKG